MIKIVTMMKTEKVYEKNEEHVTTVHMIIKRDNCNRRRPL